MISITEYAEHVYRYASLATEKHITETVLQPLGLCTLYSQKQELEGNESEEQQKLEEYRNVHSLEDCHTNNKMHSYLHLFATPPCTTNVRLTGHDITSRSEQVARMLANNGINYVKNESNNDDDAEEQESCSDNIESSKTNKCNRIKNVESENWSIQWWHDIGLPYAAIVIPKQLHNHHKCIDWECTNSSSSDNKKLPLVCVDVGCAEAILRGSDVFAPGVMYLSQSHFVCGQPVHVVWVVESQEKECCDEENEKVETKLKTATVPHIHETILQYHQHNNQNDNCRVAADGLHYYNITDRTSSCSSNIASSYYKTYIVLLAEGFAEMDSRTLSQHSEKGLAVRVTWNAFQQPSSLTLEHLFTPHNVHHSSVNAKNNDHQPEECEQCLHRVWNTHEHRGKLFLQNYSSMVPVSLLVRRLCASQERPWKLLDACAAPGGKTSLLISLLQEELKCRQYTNIGMESEKNREAGEEEGINKHQNNNNNNNNFIVVACERSRARFATLQHTLYSHFTNEENHNNKKAEENVLLCDANRDLAKVNSTKEDNNNQFLQKVLRLYNVDVNKLSSSATVSVCAHLDQIEEQPCNKFTVIDDKHKERNMLINNLEHERECQDAFDGIVLDPPCTGMGLRPRLLPHYNTTAEKEIIAAADYQRKLFDSCIRLLYKHNSCSIESSINNENNDLGDCVAMEALSLAKEERHKRTGYIVYSTCTITIEENEQNVLYFLQRYPFLRLARACNKAEEYLCNKLSSTRYTQANSCAINTTKGNTHKDNMSEELDTQMITTKPFLLYDEIMEIQRLREFKEAQNFEQHNDKETRCSVENGHNVENKEQCAKVDKKDVVDVMHPVLVLRFMPREEHSITNNYACNNYDYNTSRNVREDGVGFFVAVFETIW